MIQYTTPTITLRVKNIALSNSDRVWLTIQQYDKDTKSVKGEPMTIDSPNIEVDGNDTLVSVTLTQEQSASFAIGSVQMQVNWLTSLGIRGATGRANLTVQSNLLDEVKTNA